MNEYIQDYFANITRRHSQTNEYMLSHDEIMHLLTHITQTKCAIILGGDIINQHGQHAYRNWHFEPDNNLSYAQNAQNSCDQALRYINQLPLHTQYFYVPVLDSEI